MGAKPSKASNEREFDRKNLKGGEVIHSLKKEPKGKEPVDVPHPTSAAHRAGANRLRNERRETKGNSEDFDFLGQKPARKGARGESARRKVRIRINERLLDCVAVRANLNVKAPECWSISRIPIKCITSTLRFESVLRRGEAARIFEGENEGFLIRIRNFMP
jgi:hypothetical protein